MNSALNITGENLGIGKGLLEYLRENLDKLAAQTKHYPVMFRCGEFRTIFTCKQDIQDLATSLDEKIQGFLTAA